MNPITITITALAVPYLTLLDLEKVLDAITIPGIVIEDYEIEGLDDDAVSPEQSSWERREYERDMDAAYYS